MKTANRIKKTNRSRRGSILVVCMVLAALGTIGVAAWVTLLDARGHVAEQAEVALDRQITRDNSLALGREVLYSKYLHAASGASDGEQYVIPGNWGQVTFDGGWTGPVLGYVDNTRINKMGAVPFRAFCIDAKVDVYDGGSEQSFTFQLKSYNPALGGDLVTIHKNTHSSTQKSELTGDLRIEGRALCWGAEYDKAKMTSRTNAVLTATESEPNLALLDTSDNPILPSNAPYVTQTSGAVAGSANLVGNLNVVNNSGSSANSYVHKIAGYGPGFSTSINGTTPGGRGPGYDTIVPSDDDPSLIIMIDSGMYTADNLAPYAPLSSQILTKVLTDFDLPVGELQSILKTNIPLPDDVYDDVQNSIVLNSLQKDAVFEENDYYVRAWGDGTVEVNLNSPTLPHVLINDATTVRLRGQPDKAAADALENAEPRIIAVENSFGNATTSFEFTEMNRRRIVFAAKNTWPPAGTIPATGLANCTFTGSTAFPDWRMIFEMESIPTTWDTSTVGGVRLYGGIRTDQKIDVASGTVTVRKEEEYQTLETMASRSAWVEIYRN